MEERFFGNRIAQLRGVQGVSAREMSFALGQSDSYINKIENGRSFPSMPMFFEICNFLEVTPRDFFDEEAENPILINEVVQDLKKLDRKKILSIHEIIKWLKR